MRMRGAITEWPTLRALISCSNYMWHKSLPGQSQVDPYGIVVMRQRLLGAVWVGIRIV